MSDIRKNSIKKIITVISVALALFEIYTAATIPLTAMEQRSAHLGLIFALVFLSDSLDRKHKLIRIMDYVLAALSVLANAYIFLNWDKMGMRSTALTEIDIIVSILLVALVMITTYKTIGIWMTLISGLFILYAIFGPYMPGVLQFRGISLNRALSSICLGSEGIFGSTTGVSATFVFMFLMFGEFLLSYGGGDFIMQLALSAFGGMRGAAAKIAVISSGLFGMVSGSATANVAATGTFTIPMMKKRGYTPEFSAAIVAASTTGGLLMPPVMGTAAFIMAEMMGVPYGEVCLIAAIPAFLYFASLFFVADLNAAKNGDTAIPKHERPDWKGVFKSGWHHLISLAVLVVLLCVLQMSAAKACFYSIAALLVTDYTMRIVRKDKIHVKNEFARLTEIFVRASKAAFAVACACACAGIVVGVFAATGLNLRFSNMLVDLAGGSQILLLILSMVGAIILGMGLPTVSVYILMAIIVAPALIQTGIPMICAHMFLFYFGLMAPITPPVGVAFYVAAGVADAKPMRTGFKAALLAIPGFIMPFMFIYDPALILQGSALQTVWAAFTCFVGILALDAVISGYFEGTLPHLTRIVLVVASIMTIVPEVLSSIIGIGIIAVVFILRYVKARKQERLNYAET